MTPLQVTVGVAATQVLPESGARQAYVIVNNSLANMWIGPDNTVTALTGFLLAAGQQFGADNDPAALWAIGAAGGQALGVATIP